MKGLYQRGNTWWIRYSVNGRQERESLETTDEAQAIEAARRILANPHRLEAKVWEREVDAYLKAKVDSRKMGKNTANSRRSVLMAFARSHGVTHPNDITTKMAERWHKERQAEVEEVTAQTHVRWLSTFLDYLVEIRKLRRNPVEVEMHEVRKAKRKKFCSKDQVRQLIDNCPDDQLRFILYAGFHCGLRREEIVQVRPEWIDLDNGLLHVQRSDTWEPKDRDDRTIPMTKEFSEWLRDVYGLRSPFLVEPNKKEGNKWRYRYDFRRPFTDHVTAQGLPWVTPHTMRRTFASLKVSAGVSLYKVAIWLGDLERVVQDHYGYLIPQDSDIERGL